MRNQDLRAGSSGFWITPARAMMRPMNFALRLAILTLVTTAVWFLVGLLGITGSSRSLLVTTLMALPTGYFFHRRADDV
jgi:hypothetical protein